jgi:hypothetical protein
MDLIENIVPNNSSIIDCVSVAVETLFTEPLLSNGRILWVHYSGLQESQYALYTNSIKILKSTINWNVMACSVFEVY